MIQRAKIYDFVYDHVLTAYPFAIDYKKDVKVRFAVKKEFDQYGFLVRVTYYENEIISIDENTKVRTVEFDNEILKVEFVYHISQDYSVSSRICTRSWMNTNNEYPAVFQISKPKYYDGLEAIRAGMRRRVNVIDSLKAKTVMCLLMSGEVPTVPEGEDLAKPLVAVLSSEINAFIEANARIELENAINNVNKFAWIDNPVPAYGSLTIRQILVNTISNSEISPTT